MCISACSGYAFGPLFMQSNGKSSAGARKVWGVVLHRGMHLEPLAVWDGARGAFVSHRCLGGSYDLSPVAWICAGSRAGVITAVHALF